MKRLTTYNRLRTLGLGPVLAWRLSAPLTPRMRMLIHAIAPFGLIASFFGLMVWSGR